MSLSNLSQAGASLVGGWQSAKGPEVWRARDRLLAIGSTGTFHSNSVPIAETRESSSIGVVFKLQRIRNCIKQILQKRQKDAWSIQMWHLIVIVLWYESIKVSVVRLKTAMTMMRYRPILENAHMACQFSTIVI